MLIEFSVQNFMSFKNKVTLSMEKGIGSEHQSNTFKANDLELLKTAAIYGANASGKSSLIKALTTAILMVRHSNIIPLDGKWKNIVPFKFDKKLGKEPSTFEFIFISNQTKYRYKFTADANKIYEEKLEAYYSQKPSTIFSRTNTNTYVFNKSDEKILKSIESKNTENKLFLATASNWNYDKTKDAFLWFTNVIDTYSSFEKISSANLKNYREDQSLKEFSLNLLKEVDIFIKDFHIDYEEKEVDRTLAEILPLSKMDSAKMINVNIEIDHEIIDENKNSHIYKLNFNDESSGTKILFALAPFLKTAFESSKVIIIDELEKSLHPILVKYLINLFHSPNINKSNSQLIFTTHADSLLDLDMFRRDQVWFTEKNPSNGISDLYSLEDFSVRKSENIRKGYLNGRFGAIPFIKDNLWLDE